MHLSNTRLSWSARSDRISLDEVPVDRSGSVHLWVLVGAGVALAGIVILVLLVRSWLLKAGPIWSENDWPPELSFATKGDSQEVRDRVRLYSLGGYVDSEYLWRMEASPERVAMLAKHWALLPVGKERVPRQFWRMPPNWWSPAAIGNVDFLASEGFTATERGIDGEHFFVMHDRSQKLLYVWCKINF